MKIRKSLALAGSVIMAVGSLSVVGAQVAQASPTAVGAGLTHRMPSDARHAGRSRDGHGGEHGGGASNGHHGQPVIKAKPAKKSTKKRDPRGGGNHGGNHGGGNHGGNHGGGGCHYPPSRTHQITFSGPSHTKRGKAVTLTGKVSHNGCKTSGSTVGLYSSHDGRTGWVLIARASAGADGSFSFSVPGYALHYYQSVIAPGGGYSVVASPIVPVHVRGH